MKRNYLTELLLIIIVALLVIMWYFVNYTEHRMEKLVITNFSNNKFEKDSIQISLNGVKLKGLSDSLPSKDAITFSKLDFGIPKGVDTFKIRIFNKETTLTTLEDIKIIDDFDTNKYIFIKFYRENIFGDVYRINITDNSNTVFFKNFVFINLSHSLLAVSAVYTSDSRRTTKFPWPDNRDIKIYENFNHVEFDSFDYFMTDKPLPQKRILDDDLGGPRDPSAGIGVEMGNSSKFLELLKLFFEFSIGIWIALLKIFQIII